MFFSQQRKIKLPALLYARLQASAERAGYATVDEFIVHALEQAAERLDSQAKTQLLTDDQHLDQQLRGLGYLE